MSASVTVSMVAEEFVWAAKTLPNRSLNKSKTLLVSLAVISDTTVRPATTQNLPLLYIFYVA